MQVKPTAVWVKGPSEESMKIEKPTVLMGDYGLWVKDDIENTLILYTWERVISVAFEDAAQVKKVWEEAVLTVFEDLLDDIDFDGDDVSDKPDEPDEPEETTPEATEDKTAPAADDPTVNPYE
jgi:hypothetical protein